MPAAYLMVSLGVAVATLDGSSAPSGGSFAEHFLTYRAHFSIMHGHGSVANEREEGITNMRMLTHTHTQSSQDSL